MEAPSSQLRTSNIRVRQTTRTPNNASEKSRQPDRLAIVMVVVVDGHLQHRVRRDNAGLYHTPSNRVLSAGIDAARRRLPHICHRARKSPVRRMIIRAWLN